MTLMMGGVTEEGVIWLGNCSSVLRAKKWCPGHLIDKVHISRDAELVQWDLKGTV